MALRNDVDKAKVRVAVKIYLEHKGEATAKELSNFVNGLDLRLRGELNPNVMAKDLLYCSTQTKNFLNVKRRKTKTNAMVYFLDE